MKGLKVYLAHPISGLSYDEVIEYYSEISKILESVGYIVFHPMKAKDVLKGEKKFEKSGYVSNPVVKDHAIKERDKWMVKNSDILFVNFENTKDVSIGCVAELAWADDTPTVHSIVVLPKNNIHNHAFIKEMADIIFETTEEALEYLEALIKSEE